MLRRDEMGEVVVGPSPNRKLIAVAVLTASFLSAMDLMVVSTAMPTIVGQLGGISLYSWVFSAYILASTVSVPIYGKLADLYGRKPTFLAAGAMSIVGSALCGQAQTMEQLILFRFLQGLGGGGLQPLTMTILGDSFPLEQRAKLNGIFAAVWGFAAFVGPAVGGFLTERADWRWVFYVNLPLCGLAMLLVWLFLAEPKRVRSRRPRLDVLGAVLLAGGATTLLLGLGGAVESLTTGSTLPLLGLAGVLFALFVWQERRAEEPLLPLRLLRQRIIVVGTLGAALIGAATFTQSSFVPPFVQGVVGATPTASGFVVAAATIGWPTAAGLSGWLILRWGYRAVGLLGGAVLTAASLALALVQPEDSLFKLAAINAMIGAGLGFLNPVGIFAMQNAVPWGDRGVATSTNHFARNLGGAIGVSVSGAIFAASVAARAGGIEADPNALLTTGSRASLMPTELAALQESLAEALRSVYLMLVGVGATAWVLAAFLPRGRAQDHTYQAQAARTPSTTPEMGPPPGTPLTGARH